MKKQLSCGQYDICITGNEELISLIPDTWDKFRQDQMPNGEAVVIHIEYADSLQSGMSEGWKCVDINGLQQAAYFGNGKLCFALQRDKANEVILRIGKALDSYVRIGLHYSLMYAVHQKSVGLHGVTLLCGNEITILSAPSGTGKTTLAGLLEQYCDAIVVNGDFALLTPTENGLVYEPTPFCGSSGRSLKQRMKVNRIVFLSQAKENIWSETDARKAVIQLMNNAYIPTWDKQAQQSIQDNILKSIALVKVNGYAFAPTREAAETFVGKIMNK